MNIRAPSLVVHRRVANDARPTGSLKQAARDRSKIRPWVGAGDRPHALERLAVNQRQRCAASARENEQKKEREKKVGNNRAHPKMLVTSEM